MTVVPQIGTVSEDSVASPEINVPATCHLCQPQLGFTEPLNFEESPPVFTIPSLRDIPGQGMHYPRTLSTGAEATSSRTNLPVSRAEAQRTVADGFSPITIVRCT